MTNPVRIQRKRTKGWRMPENTIAVSRPGEWGNPFVFADRTNAELVEYYRCWIEDGEIHPDIDTHFEAPDGSRTRILGLELPSLIARTALLLRINELRGKNLACWCPLTDVHGNKVPCHADVLLELANAN